MNPDPLTSLPSEIIFNIILRLPLRAIAISKCVCKPWLRFLESDDFVKFHLSKSAPALAAMTMEEDADWFKVFELEGELDLGSHDRRRDPLSKFSVRRGSTIEGSANGLLLLTVTLDSLSVFNPMTREICELHTRGAAFGLGTSRVTGQYKVVSINPAESDCHVHTLGTGSWRRVEAGATFDYGSESFGAFFNGNLHWLVSLGSGSDRIILVSCFDVETERFSTFPAPPTTGSCRRPWYLYGLGDRLCFSDESADDEIAIWFVKDYEGEKTWSKECVIVQNLDFDIAGNDFLRPIEVFENGDLLMMCDAMMFIYYSNETKTARKIVLLGAEDEYYFIGSMLLTPSFLSLRRNLGMENVVIV